MCCRPVYSRLVYSCTQVGCTRQSYTHSSQLYAANVRKALTCVDVSHWFKVHVFNIRRILYSTIVPFSIFVCLIFQVSVQSVQSFSCLYSWPVCTVDLSIQSVQSITCLYSWPVCTVDLSVQWTCLYSWLVCTAELCLQLISLYSWHTYTGMCIIADMCVSLNGVYTAGMCV
jgi:hypothetical protein